MLEVFRDQGPVGGLLLALMYVPAALTLIFPLGVLTMAASVLYGLGWG